MKPYRKEKVASAVHTLIGELLIDGLNDPRIEPLTTITRVEMASDLSVALVFVTVPGEMAAERRTMQALRHAAGHVRRILAQELSLRHCPEVRFEVDESAKKARETLRLLEENRKMNPALFTTEAESEGPEDADDLDLLDDWAEECGSGDDLEEEVDGLDGDAP
jgi:ribosome-binding factor A